MTTFDEITAKHKRIAERVRRANLIRDKKRLNKEYLMRYYLMNNKYEWTEVCLDDYYYPPSGMIGNKAKVNPDGLITVSVGNIFIGQLISLAKKLNSEL